MVPARSGAAILKMGTKRDSWAERAKKIVPPLSKCGGTSKQIFLSVLHTLKFAVWLSRFCPIRACLIPPIGLQATYVPLRSLAILTGKWVWVFWVRWTSIIRFRIQSFVLVGISESDLGDLLILGRPLFFPLIVRWYSLCHFNASVFIMNWSIWRETTSGMYVLTLSVLFSDISSSVQKWAVHFFFARYARESRFVPHF